MASPIFEALRRDLEDQIDVFIYGLHRQGYQTPLVRAVFERKLIEHELRRNANNVSKTKKAVGLSKATLYRRMDEYGIRWKETVKNGRN